MCPRFFVPTGFRTVGNTCAGIADRSLGGMGGSDVYIDAAMGGMVEDAVPDPAEELPPSTLTYHNSIMSYPDAILDKGSSKLSPLKCPPSLKMTQLREYCVSGGTRTDLGMSFRVWKL